MLLFREAARARIALAPFRVNVSIVLTAFAAESVHPPLPQQDYATLSASAATPAPRCQSAGVSAQRNNDAIKRCDHLGMSRRRIIVPLWHRAYDLPFESLAGVLDS